MALKFIQDIHIFFSNHLEFGMLKSVDYECTIAGAICRNGSFVESIITGTIWIAVEGTWVLTGCSSGYYVSSEMCKLCPSSFFCRGGSISSTPCPEGLFSLPGANDTASCFRCVFVLVTINIRIPRPDFSDRISESVQQALANVAKQSIGYVTINTVMESAHDSTTVIISKVATQDAIAASLLANGMDSNKVRVGLASFDLLNSSLLNVQLTACVPGFELLATNLTCRRCPANFYCVGGTDPREPCPAGSFAYPGSNNSSSCHPVIFVVVVVALPISGFSLTDSTETEPKLQMAIALTAGVSSETVVLVLINSGRRSDAQSGQVLVTAEIAVDDSSISSIIKNKIVQTTLNRNLVALGLPECSLVSVSETGSQTQSSNTAAIIGGSVGSFIFLIMVCIGAHALIYAIWNQQVHRAFLAAVKSAKVGDSALRMHLPLELRQNYKAENIIGKGSFGCVIQATLKTAKPSVSVAIKLLPPINGVFSDKELRQLRREENILSLFTLRKCEHAVNLAGLGTVHVKPDLCWFIMEFLDGDNMDLVVHGLISDNCLSDSDSEHSGSSYHKPHSIGDTECIKVARSILAALKVMHSEGIVHRDIKPANIVRCRIKHTGIQEGQSASAVPFVYKLIDFGSALGIDEAIANESMLTLIVNRDMAAGTLPYMSPEMFKEPKKASYSTDLWSLGVTMFELVTSSLPFKAESDLLWSFAVAGNMEAKAPSVLDKLAEGIRAKFDHNLARIIARALEKHVAYRYTSVDEMHDDVYNCLIVKGEAFYSVFISYRVASEAPLASLLFDELNHSITPGGHRVTVYWDSHRLIKGQDWEKGFATGLLSSLCFFPLLSYGATAPLADIPEDMVADARAHGWEIFPFGRQRLKGIETDCEDNVLKELIIAHALIEGSGSEIKSGKRNKMGLLQLAYPILVGRQEPEGHPNYPCMGNFFKVQGGGGKYPSCPSSPTNKAVSSFLQQTAGVDVSSAKQAEKTSVEAAVKSFTRLQGCQLWNHAQDLKEIKLSKQQMQLIGKGYAGPPVDLDGIKLNPKQVLVEIVESEFYSPASFP